jgi:hypothetical protein
MPQFNIGDNVVVKIPYLYQSTDLDEFVDIVGNIIALGEDAERSLLKRDPNVLFPEGLPGWGRLCEININKDTDEHLHIYEIYLDLVKDNVLYLKGK